MRRIGFVYLLMIATAIGLVACKGGADAPGGMGDPSKMPPPELGVITATAGTVSLQQELVGRLAPFRSADVRARVPGILQKRVYTEGSDVKEGQVLFQIDAAPMQAALAQAEGAQAQVQATYANAHASAERARQLASGQYISKSDVDNALAAERSGAAAVQAGTAAVTAARINLGYATVRAPIAGRAGKQQVTEGALVGQGEATLLTTVDQVDPLYVNFSMSVSELQQLRVLQHAGDAQSQVQVVLPDGSIYSHPGSVDFSGDVVDPATGAVALRALVPNPDKLLLPGTYVSLKATMGQIPNAYLIPKLALQRDTTGAYLLVVGSDGMVARKDVDANEAHGSDWIVTKGLAGGEQVVVSGLQRAQAGKPAKAVPWQPDAAPGAVPSASAPGTTAVPAQPAAGKAASSKPTKPADASGKPAG